MATDSKHLTGLGQYQRIQAGSSTSGSGVSKKGCIARSSGTSGSVSSGWACPIFCRQRHVDRRS